MFQDAAVSGLIDEVVSEWTNAGRIFTAFEVSLEVKTRGARVRHREIKSAIHDTVERIGGSRYTRTLMDVGAPVQAFVYHRREDNPFGYEPLQRNDPPAPARADRGGHRMSRPAPGAEPVGNDDSGGSPATPPSADGSYDARDDGGLTVPAIFLSQLKITAGDRVQLQFRELEEQVLVTRCGPSPDEHALTILPSGEVSISAEQLARAGLDGLETFDIAGSEHSIRISEGFFSID